MEALLQRADAINATVLVLPEAVATKVALLQDAQVWQQQLHTHG